MTLVEVLLAAAILALGLSVLLTGASRCVASLGMARRYQDAQWAMTMGEAVHFVVATGEVSELEVSGDTDLIPGYTFSRTVEEDDDEDGLCVVRTRVSWRARGREFVEERVGYAADLQEDDAP